MSVLEQTNYQRIINFIDLIQKKPKKDVKFFFFDAGKKFVVNGKMIKLLPMEYQKLSTKDEFYIHVNPEEKKVMYWAYDIKDYVNAQPIAQEEGYMTWEKVEDCIYNFLAINIRDLSETVAPYNEVGRTSSTTSSSSSSYSNKDHGGGFIGGGSNNYPYSGGTTTTYDYSSPSYKEREAFFTKLGDLVKEAKTAVAMDLIDEQIGKMKAEKRFDDINTLLARVYFDKLSTITMLGLLTATAGEDDKLKERKVFYGKVQEHLRKINVKKDRQAQMLKNLAPAEAPAVAPAT